MTRKLTNDSNKNNNEDKQDIDIEHDTDDNDNNINASKMILSILFPTHVELGMCRTILVSSKHTSSIVRKVAGKGDAALACLECASVSCYCPPFYAGLLCKLSAFNRRCMTCILRHLYSEHTGESC